MCRHPDLHNGTVYTMEIRALPSLYSESAGRYLVSLVPKPNFDVVILGRANLILGILASL